MTLIGLILILALIGLLVWLITSFIPMDPKFKLLIQIVALVIVIIWLLGAFGLVSDIRVPRL